MKRKLFLLTFVFFCNKLIISQTLKEYLASRPEVKNYTDSVGYRQGLWAEADHLENVLNIITVGKYIDDKKDGLWIKCKKGRVFRLGNYKDGKREGVFVDYNMKTGIIKYQAEYKNNMLNGLAMIHSRKGKLIAIYRYENNQKVEILLEIKSKELPLEKDFLPTYHFVNNIDAF